MEQEIQPQSRQPINPIPPNNNNKIIVAIVSFLIIIVLATIGYFIFSKPWVKLVKTQTQQSSISEETLSYIPLVVSLEGAKMKTSACLQVREKIYDTNITPWDNFKNTVATNPETDLVKIISAIQNKDSKLFENLSHSVLGSDPQKRKAQEVAYFQQFDSLQLGDVWGYQRFGDLSAFYLQIVSKTGTSGFTNFLFAGDKAGGFGFLPYKSDSLTFRLASDWFSSEWGPSKSQTPSYCPPALVEQMTHKVVIGNDNDLNSSAELLLMGNNLTDANNKNNFSSDLLSQFTKMQEALASGRMDEYFGGYTANAEKIHRDWFSTKDKEHKQYIENFVAQKPFYVFNAEPVLIVYAVGKGGITGGNLRISYFVRNAEGQFKLTEESFGSAFDKTFKSKKFIEAANLEKPFGVWEIK